MKVAQILIILLFIQLMHPTYARGSNEARSFLAGSYYFQVADIEVYTKI